MQITLHQLVPETIKENRALVAPAAGRRWQKENNMGQAKQRGSQEERAKQAREKIEMMKPATIVCNACKAEITDIHAMDTRGMPGIQAVFAGMCSCGHTTHAMLGDGDAVADLVMAMEETNGEQGILGSQLYKPPTPE